MKTTATFVGFAGVFLVGMLLVVIGTAASQWVDCPAALEQFPAAETRCNLFSGFVYGGALMAVVGVAVFSWVGMFGKWPDQHQ